MPSPAAAGVPAATVFLLPQGLPAGWTGLALPLLLVPAALMVSTIRYRSFKTFNLNTRRPASALMLAALGLAAIATYPQWSLVLVSYTYLLSGFVGLAWGRLRPRTVEDTATVPAEPVVSEGPREV
jgi:CDP-diacylglycerol---serine O-phosphatidyltransferase